MDRLSGEILSAWPCRILELAPGGTGGPGGQSRGPGTDPEGVGPPTWGPTSVPFPPGRASLQSLFLLLFVTCPLSVAPGCVRQLRGSQKRAEAEKGGERREEGGGSLGPREMFRALVA